MTRKKEVQHIKKIYKKRSAQAESEMNRYNMCNIVQFIDIAKTKDSYLQIK